MSDTVYIAFDSSNGTGISFDCMNQSIFDAFHNSNMVCPTII